MGVGVVGRSGGKVVKDVEMGTEISIVVSSSKSKYDLRPKFCPV